MISQLIEKGVSIPSPQSVEIGLEVEFERISADNVAIHGGSRIFGSRTLICRGAVIGREAPATVENCYIGPGVQLKGGYYKDAVFLAGASVGSGAHIREGTILEEQASAAHTVGLKQTILFPFVTLGSLINFCDCLMSGGTSRKNHSEVGSSYIHFNYTPQQDKATPSLLGDVPNGVMLNQPPIFLGGQGGMVGPCRLTFGSVIAAGTINRKDELRPGRLIFGGPGKSGNIPYPPSAYRNIKRIVTHNLHYIASLHALRQWYCHVRSLFIGDMMPQPLFEGLLHILNGCIEERIIRLGAFVAKLAESADRSPEITWKQTSDALLGQKRQLFESWDQLEQSLRTPPDTIDSTSKRAPFLAAINKAIKRNGKQHYVKAIQSLSADQAAHGTAWLQWVIEELTSQWRSFIPTLDNS